MTDFFTVVEVDGVNPVTLLTETIRLTDRKDYVGNDYIHVPALKEVFNFEESLFDTGTTNANIRIGVGQVVAINNSGVFDKYQFYGFDGQAISIYNLTDPLEVPSNTNLTFRGTMYYAALSWDEVIFYVKNRFEDLNVKACKAAFLGTNAGPTGLEGTKDDLKDKSKPRLYGQCLNIPWYRLNSSLEIYGCNFDNDGNRKAVTAIWNVLDKGGEIQFEGDTANATALQAASVTAGKYKSCLAEGLIKLGTPAKGDVTGDVYEALGEDASAPRVTQRILQDTLGFQSGIDYDPESLQLLHAKNAASVGIFIEGEDKVLDCCNKVLDSIGGFMVPDFKGTFFFGRVELPDRETSPSVATFTDDYINKDTLDRLMTGDDGHGIPCGSVKLNHTRAWKVVDEGSVLESVSSQVKSFITQQYRSTVSPNIGLIEDKSNRAYTVRVIHKLAPDLVFDTLLVDPRPLKLRNGDFTLRQLSLIPSLWDVVSEPGTSDISVNSEQCTLTPDGTNNPYMVQNIGIAGSVGYTGTSLPDELYNCAMVLTFDIVSGFANLQQFFTANGVTSAANTFTSLGRQTVNYNFVGNPASGLLVSFQTISAVGGAATIDNVALTMAQYGLTTTQEADRRFAMLSADTERYKFVVPYRHGKNIGLGQIITLQCSRFGMQDGKMFLVIGRSVDSDDETVALDILG